MNASNASDIVIVTSVPEVAERFRSRGLRVELLTREEAREWWRERRKQIVADAQA